MIYFNDFISEYKLIKDEINNAISKVLDSGWYILGKEVESFEKDFAKYLGVKYCVGVASGMDAITISLMGLGIKEGDEVITTNFTAYPTITGIMRSGAKPILVDIKIKDGLIDPDDIEKRINDRTKAIIPVHLFGQSCAMDKICSLAKKYRLKIVEDCAQSAGSTFNKSKLGTIGDCGAFSFYPTKNIGAIGDGGLISTNNDSLYNKFLLLRNYGQNSRYKHEINGLNSRLDELQASILKVKLKYLDSSNDKRRQFAMNYNENLVNVEPLKDNGFGHHVYHLYVVKCSNRLKLQKHLKEKGIQTIIHYPHPINKQKAFPYQNNEHFPRAEELTKNILSLPIHPYLKIGQLEKIISSINRF